MGTNYVSGGQIYNKYNTPSTTLQELAKNMSLEDRKLTSQPYSIDGVIQQTQPTSTYVPTGNIPSTYNPDVPAVNIGSGNVGGAAQLLGSLASPGTAVSSNYPDILNAATTNLYNTAGSLQGNMADMAAAYNALLNSAGSNIAGISNMYGTSIGNLMNSYGQNMQGLNNILPTYFQNLGIGENFLGNAAATNLQGLQTVSPAYGQSIANMSQLFNSLSGQLQNAQYNTGVNSQQLWNQYMDVYQNMMNAINSTQTGQLAPATQQWLDTLKGSQESALNTQLQNWQNDQYRTLVDTMSGRGILTSDVTKNAMDTVNKEASQRLLEGENSILQQYAQAALQLPFSQVEAAVQGYQGPQTGATLMNTTSQAYQAMAPYYDALIQAGVAPAQISSSFMDALNAVTQNQMTAGQGIADIASQYLQPSQVNAQLIGQMADLINTYAGTEYGAAQNLANLGANTITANYQNTVNAYNQLLEAYNKPAEMYGQATDIYGGMASNYTNAMVNEMAAQLNAQAQQYAANASAQAQQYAAAQSAYATQYAAAQQAAASKYVADQNYAANKYYVDNYNPSGSSGDSDTWSAIGSIIQNFI